MTTKVPNEEDLALVADVAGRTLDAAEVVDEHLRYRYYVDALSAVLPDRERDLLVAISRDPDIAMRESVLAKHIDAVAASAPSPESYAGWLDAMHDWIGGSDFLMQRAREWLLFREVEAGTGPDPTAILSGSDWLQRKLSEESSSATALRALAESGATRRVRTAAARRLAALESTP